MIKVVKFGGSSVANANQFKKVKNIVNAEAARKFVVTSACGKEGKDEVMEPTDQLFVDYVKKYYKEYEPRRGATIDKMKMTIFDKWYQEY